LGTLSTYQKTITASTGNLSAARDFVAQHAIDHGFDKQLVADIRLAVDEAITNIIKHAYLGDDTRSINIDITFEEEKICIQLQDTGKTFNLKSYTEPDIKSQIKQKKRGGMGVYLIHSLMDTVSYERKNGTNEMIMCKYRS